ncbi:hypothetical protein JW930_06055 [Candidatus Woesearchaeota archaeon]|nr:hypothetical protein [Candidatus Woesearchaeota archaeon]
MKKKNAFFAVFVLCLVVSSTAAYALTFSDVWRFVVKVFTGRDLAGEATTIQPIELDTRTPEASCSCTYTCRDGITTGPCAGQCGTCDGVCPYCEGIVDGWCDIECEFYGLTCTQPGQMQRCIGGAHCGEFSCCDCPSPPPCPENYIYVNHGHTQDVIDQCHAQPFWAPYTFPCDNCNNEGVCIYCCKEAPPAPYCTMTLDKSCEYINGNFRVSGTYTVDSNLECQKDYNIFRYENGDLTVEIAAGSSWSNGPLTFQGDDENPTQDYTYRIWAKAQGECSGYSQCGKSLYITCTLPPSSTTTTTPTTTTTIPQCSVDVDASCKVGSPVPPAVAWLVTMNTTWDVDQTPQWPNPYINFTLQQYIGYWDIIWEKILDSGTYGYEGFYPSSKWVQITQHKNFKVVSRIYKEDGSVIPGCYNVTYVTCPTLPPTTTTTQPPTTTTQPPTTTTQPPTTTTQPPTTTTQPPTTTTQPPTTTTQPPTTTTQPPTTTSTSTSTTTTTIPCKVTLSIECIQTGYPNYEIRGTTWCKYLCGDYTNVSVSYGLFNDINKNVNALPPIPGDWDFGPFACDCAGPSPDADHDFSFVTNQAGWYSGISHVHHPDTRYQPNGFFGWLAGLFRRTEQIQPVPPECIAIDVTECIPYVTTTSMSTTSTSTTSSSTTTSSTTTTTVPCFVDLEAVCDCPEFVDNDVVFPTSAFIFDCTNNFDVDCEDDDNHDILDILRDCSGITNVSINVDKKCGGQWATRAVYVGWHNLTPENYEYLTKVDLTYIEEKSTTGKYLIQIYTDYSGAYQWEYLCDEFGTYGTTCDQPFNLTQYWDRDELSLAKIRVLAVHPSGSFNYYSGAETPSDENYTNCYEPHAQGMGGGIQCHSYSNCVFVNVSYCPYYEIRGNITWDYLEDSNTHVSIPPSSPYLWDEWLDTLSECNQYIYQYCNVFTAEGFDIEPGDFYDVYGQVHYNGPIPLCDDLATVWCEAPDITTTTTLPSTTTTTPPTTTTTYPTTTSSTTTITQISTTTSTTTTTGPCGYTPGGWGTDCPNPDPCAQTSQPGCLRDCYWLQAFPNSPHDFVIGDGNQPGGYTVTFNIDDEPYYGQNVADFLPSQATGPASCLYKDWTNPKYYEDIGTGQFIDNLAAAKLNLVYSDAGATPPGFGDIIVTFQGNQMTARDFIAIAEGIISCRQENCCYDKATMVEASEVCDYLNNDFHCDEGLEITPAEPAARRNVLQRFFGWLTALLGPR